jgi:biotin carboxyl carrier protein
MKVVPPVSIGVAGGFTRSTTGTFIGSNGLLQTAAINVPRFSYDVEDLDAAPAFLQESAATNKLLRSRDGTNAAWTKTDTSTAQTQTGIDGSSNAATLYTEGTAGTALVVQAGDTVSAGSTITYSEYLKRGNTDWVRLVVGETTLTDLLLLLHLTLLEY